jgi:hypothetical protein
MIYGIKMSTVEFYLLSRRNNYERVPLRTEAMLYNCARPTDTPIRLTPFPLRNFVFIFLLFLDLSIQRAPRDRKSVV